MHLCARAAIRAEFWFDRAINNSSCGLDGAGDAAHQLQNRVKNELSAGNFLTNSPYEKLAEGEEEDEGQ